jgi:hypothetical protein
MPKFKIGDKVKVINDEDCWYAKLNDILTIESWDQDEDDPYYSFEETTDNLYESHLELLRKPSKEKQMKDLKKSKFMVYGTGCDNKTDWYDTKKEAQEKAQELAYDSSWTGDLLICEIKPLGLVEKAIKIKSL